jgi:hypothetical protein
MTADRAHSPVQVPSPTITGNPADPGTSSVLSPPKQARRPGA